MGHRPTVLCCWEYGAGHGHLEKLGRVAIKLKERGWKVLLALPAIEVAKAQAFPPAASFDGFHPVPDARDLLAKNAQERHAARSYNDIVEAFGYGDARRVFTRVKVWQSVFENTSPDLIVADFAPGAIMAAKGTIPIIGTGTGYTLPPDDIESYPAFFPGKEGRNSSVLLDNINRGLSLAGLSTIRAIPHLLQTDYAACCSLKFLDPFSEVRKKPVLGPGLSKPLRMKVAKRDDRTIFVYLSDVTGDCGSLLAGLASWKGNVTVYARGLSETQKAVLQTGGATILSSPEKLEKVAEIYSLIVHRGGHNLMVEAMLLGVPQLIYSTDVEKVLHGERAEDAGLAHHHRASRLKSASDVADAISIAFEDREMRDRTTDFADNFPAEEQTAGHTALLEAAQRLVAR